MHFKITIFTYKKWSRKKKFFFRDPFLKKSLVENNSYIYVYDFPQKNFSMCHGTYSPIPDPSKNWSVNIACLPLYYIVCTWHTRDGTYLITKILFWPKQQRIRVSSIQAHLHFRKSLSTYW